MFFAFNYGIFNKHDVANIVKMHFCPVNAEP